MKGILLGAILVKTEDGVRRLGTGIEIEFKKETSEL